MDLNEWRFRQEKGPRTISACLGEYSKSRTRLMEAEEMSEEEKAHCTTNRMKELMNETSALRKEKGIKDILDSLDSFC